MIRFVLTLALLGPTSAFAAPAPTWSKKMVDDLKTKTLQQTFCDNSPGFQTKAACDYFGKDKKELSKKLISVSVQGNVLTLSDGKRSVEIKRLKDDLQFEVNRKLIDISELRDPAKLAEALAKVLPKVAVGSLWMSSAFADDKVNSANYDVMVNASALTLAFAIDDSTCEAADTFIKACGTSVENETEMEQVLRVLSIWQKGEKANKEDVRHFVPNLQELSNKVYHMKLLTFGLIQRARDANSYCSKNGWKDVSGRMDKCLADLKTIAENLKGMTCAGEGIDEETCQKTTIAVGRKLDWQEEQKIAPKGTSKSKESKATQ